MEVTLEERNYFEKGTIVEFFGPNLEAKTFVIDKIKSEEGEEITAARHPREIIKFKCDINLHKNDIMRLKTIDINTYL